MRKFSALCALSVAIFWGVLSMAASKTAAIDSKFLQPIYSRYNDTYFDGKLPQDTTVLYAPDPEDSTNVGATYCSVDPTTLQLNHCKIYVAPYANKAQPVAIETLIHEMCHVKTWEVESKDGEGSHGKEWNACMLNVARAGGMDGVW